MNESKATRYQRLKRRAGTVGALAAGVMLGLVAFTPASRWLASFSASMADGVPRSIAGVVSLAVFVTLLVVLWELATLPAVLYVARRLDRTYSRHAASVDDVLRAQAHATAIAASAAFAGAAVVLGAVALAGAWWWAAAGVMLAVALAVALHGAPAVLARIADVRPLGRRELAERLLVLARRANVSIAGIDEWHVDLDAAMTALVTGVGRRKRVFVSSELARDWSDDELAVVVAHELAHHAHGDLWRALALHVAVLSAALYAADAVVAVAGPTLGLAGPGDLAALPLIAFVATAIWWVSTPLRHAQSRRHERRADEFALAATGHAEAFGVAIRRLGDRHLAEDRPSRMTRWLYSRHPSMAERLALADVYRRTHPS